MPQICVTIEELERTVRTHLNNAQASLAAGQPRFALEGFSSAAQAAALSEVAVLHDKELPLKDVERFKEFFRQACALGNSYIAEYRFVALQQPNAPAYQPPVANGNGNGNEKSEGKESPHGAGFRLSHEAKRDIYLALRKGIPSDCRSNNEWFTRLAERFGTSSWTIKAYKDRLDGGKVGTEDE
jgi:hypothetical protein